MIYAVSDLFVQKSFLTKNYLLIAATIASTRGPLYTCLVFDILCKVRGSKVYIMTTKYVRFSKLLILDYPLCTRRSFCYELLTFRKYL